LKYFVEAQDDGVGPNVVPREPVTSKRWDWGAAALKRA
jgi:hypothetical protein